MRETREMGFGNVRAAQEDLGGRIRNLLEHQGIKSLAAPDFKAPSVVVSYTDDPDIQTGKKFAHLGMQIAAGVPLQCDEAADFRTFRIGLFGLDKLKDIDRTVDLFAKTLEQITVDDAA